MYGLASSGSPQLYFEVESTIQFRCSGQLTAARHLPVEDRTVYYIQLLIGLLCQLHLIDSSLSQLINGRLRFPFPIQ